MLVAKINGGLVFDCLCREYNRWKHDSLARAFCFLFDIDLGSIFHTRVCLRLSSGFVCFFL